jgi:HPt (histidine-containing phosphotransfer) domain-containing protein
MDAFVLKPYDSERIRNVIAGSQADLRDLPAAPTELDLQALRLYALRTNADAMKDYLAALDMEIAGVAAALGDGDSGRIAQAAHRLRNHASMVGAVPLQAIARELEARARGGEVFDQEAEMKVVLKAASALRMQLHESFAGEGL